MTALASRIKRLNWKMLFNLLYHLGIALLPVLYIVNVPGLNISLGTVILLGLVPRSLVFIVKGLNKKNWAQGLPFFMFYLYLALRSDGNGKRIILCCATFLVLYGVLKGAADGQKLRKILETYALINVALIVIQTLCYYGFHVRIQYIPRGLIYEEYRTAYVFREFSGLFRPSALFLEPSHFSQYCIFALISALFPAQKDKPNMVKALAMGLGCVLTTSGMGIGLTVGVFGWYMLFNRQSVDKKIRNILISLPVVIVAFILLWQTEFFRTALQRVFSTVEGYNAISGRTHNWADAIGTMHGGSLWFGYGDSQEYPWYLTGLADTIYKYGILCVILEGICLLSLMIKKMDNFLWCSCVVFVALFCVAHITNFISQVFYFGMFIADSMAPGASGSGVLRTAVVSIPDKLARLGKKRFHKNT